MNRLSPWLAALALACAVAGCVEPGGAPPSGGGAWGTKLVLEGFGRPEALALDGHGVLYVADADSGGVVCVFADGQRTCLAGDGPAPAALVVDRLGRVYAADHARGEVVCLESGGGRRVVARGLAGPAALALDRDGGLFVACRGDGTVRRLAPR